MIARSMNNRDNTVGFYDLDKLGWRSPYQALVTAYKPSFNICVSPVTFNKKVLPEGLSSPLVFFPGVDFGSEHDCDLLPIIMRALVPVGAGVAVDVGASEGMCTVLLLAHGHTVVSYEPDATFQEYRQMSVAANPGFSERARLLAGLGGDTGRTLDTELLHMNRGSIDLDEAHDGGVIDLLKIDVDLALEATLLGARQLLESGRVRALQVEVLAAELEGGDAKKRSLLEGLSELGYSIYVLIASQPKGGIYPSTFFADDYSQKHECKEVVHHVMDPGSMVHDGGVQGSSYQYGDNFIEALQALPLFFSESQAAGISKTKSSRKPDTDDSQLITRLNCYSQYVATKDPVLLRLLAIGILH